MSAYATRRGFRFGWAPLVVYILVGCQPQAAVSTAITTARGKAMGTSYTLKYVPRDTAQSVKQLIDAELARELANGPQVAMRLLKRSIYNAAEQSFEKA